LEDLENDEFEMDGIKIPSDAGEDDSDEPVLTTTMTKSISEGCT